MFIRKHQNFFWSCKHRAVLLRVVDIWTTDMDFLIAVSQTMESTIANIGILYLLLVVLYYLGFFRNHSKVPGMF